MAFEYRAVIICKDNPCSYCRYNELIEDKKRRSQKLVFNTEDEAFANGLSIARNVFGLSAHDIEVEARFVGPWLSEVEREELHQLRQELLALKQGV